jgi:uncharacterized membrane protein
MVNRPIMVEFIEKPASRPAPLKAVIDIPGYKILNKLGEGATAVVWRAQQTSLDRSVAIKILKEEYASDPEEVTAFINEARSIAKLKAHNIIQVYDVGQHDDRFYFVMEFVDGQTLGNLLRENGALAQKQALTIAAAVAEALEGAWKSGRIFHRDVKPDNIMLDDDGGTRLADLGLAGIIDARGKSSVAKDEVAGTPNYMSPEQTRCSHDLDFHTDMYSLGATLYHMVTGQMPFAGEDTMTVLDAQQSRKIPHPRDINANITPGCAQIIIKLMMKDPKHRYRTWSAAATELAKLAAGKIVVPKFPAGAVSTVGAPGEVPLASGPGARKPTLANKRAEERHEQLKKKYGKQRAPVWLRIPLEAALLTWFGFLVYQFVWVPAHPPEAVETPPASDTEAVEPDALPTPPILSPEPALPTHAAPSTAPAMPDAPELPSAPLFDVPPPSTPPAVAPETGTSLPQLKRMALRTLLTEGSEAARFMIKRARMGDEHAGDVAVLMTLLASDNLTQDAVAKAFEMKVGQRADLLHGNRRHRIEIKSVSGQIVSADVFVGGESAGVKRPLTFKVSQLSPVEQSRWLGEATSPRRALAKYVLHMSAGDFVTARNLADKCGPFADACAAEADARIRALIE